MPLFRCLGILVFETTHLLSIIPRNWLASLVLSRGDHVNVLTVFFLYFHVIPHLLFACFGLKVS